MKLAYAATTDVGMKRSHNEDSFTLIEADHVFMVADGMGGHASGEVASRLAVDALASFFEYTRSDDEATWPFRMDRALRYAENRLVCAIKVANSRVFEASEREERYKGMGTTCVATLFEPGRVCIAHVGDSRAYRLRGTELVQLTRDHSLLEEYKAANPDLTLDEERAFPHKSVITRALGMRPFIEVAMRTEATTPGDQYLLCSDGLSGLVGAAELLGILVEARTADHATAALIAAANRAGGTDNITAMVIRVA